MSGEDLRLKNKRLKKDYSTLKLGFLCVLVAGLLFIACFGPVSYTHLLEEVSLMTDIDNYDDKADSVIMMTMHSAKGLEFPVVFLPGFEEGIFPGLQSIYNPDEIEEERRLAYVAITRAEEEVALLNAESRMLFGSTTRNLSLIHI